jgi:hypothetical protein
MNGRISQAGGLVAALCGCENGSEAPVTDSDTPRPAKPKEDREIDYLICTQCGTPCYVFETESGRIAEAVCLVCGNDEVGMFNIGEEAGTEE